MSGFCGLVDFSEQPLDVRLVDPCMAVLAHFGGNASGRVVAPHLVLGHHLRHDTPESLLEQQPFKHPHKKLYIVADAWLDHRSDLCRALGLAEATLPNSQLILAAYEKWGEDCTGHLLGDFSFAIWDADKRRLFCARDPIGSRPFYYYQVQSRFYFANDIEALLCFEAVAPKLDLRYTRSRLEDTRFSHSRHTFFEGVKKVPFAHQIEVTIHGLTTKAHWQPEQVAPLKLESEAAYAHHLVELLDDAIRVRSRSLFEVGSHISGGLDSTAVTVMAARQHHKESRTSREFKAFAWTTAPAQSDYPLTDERKDLEAVASHENLKLYYTQLSMQDYLANFSHDLTRWPHHTLLAERVVGRNASNAGVKTLLSGWGGDEAVTFNGRGYFADLFRTGQWATFSRELRLRAALRGSGSKVWVSAVTDGLLPNVPASLIQRLPKRVARYHPAYQEPATLPLELHPSLLEALSKVEPYERDLAHVVPGVHTMQRRLLKHGHIPYRMESWYAHGERLGLSYRYPLTDKRLLEFALAVPEELFFKHGWKRYLFRRATEGIVPKELQWRASKQDVSWFATMKQMQQTSLEQKGLQRLIEARLDQLRQQQFLDVDTLLTRLEQLQVTDKGTLSSLDTSALWLAFVGPDVVV